MENLQNKILSHKELILWRNRQKKTGKKIVFTNGCFDIIHRGHITVFEKAKKLGDFLVVGLNSDSSIKRIKGKDRPLNKQQDRSFVLAALRAVDFVIIFNEDTPFNLLKKLKPDVLVKGADYKAVDIVGREFAAKTVTMPLVKGRSTTKLIKKICKK